MKTFTAPWSGLLIGVSVFGTALCLGVAAANLVHTGGRIGTPVDFLIVVALPALLVGGCALFTVRGYGVAPDAILIRRLFWFTRLPREGLQSVAYEPGAMSGSIRTFGNGGLFSFTGWYRNRALGNYRAFVTDGRRTVVLRYTRRTIVVSPGEPEEFVKSLE